MALHEFEIIDKFFTKPHKKTDRVALSVGDDAALLNVPDGYQLATSIDTLNEGVHFLPNTPAADIGYKSLAVSLSDMAAMGAEPVAALLSLSLPKSDESWIADFAHGFFELAHQYQLTLMGGNTTKGPLAISTVLYGYVPAEHALLRSTAKYGDLIYVTGNLGDAGLALHMLLQQQSVERPLLERLTRPTPRVEIGLKLRGIASACIDISDGLSADLKKILHASHVGAVIEAEKIPRSEWVKAFYSKAQAWQIALTHGDDYELCFTVPAQKEHQLHHALKSFEGFYHCIGHIEKSSGLEILDDQGQIIEFTQNGYEHFSTQAKI